MIFLFFGPHAFLRAYLELLKKVPKCPTKSSVWCSKHIVSWGNFGHLRALFLFWPSNMLLDGFWLS